TTCAMSTCGLGACKPGFSDCDVNMQNGCEAQLSVDVNNCGMCGKVCGALPHAKAKCAGGACVLGACDAGWGDCNGSAIDGCETDTTSNASNCGACGKMCVQ